MTPKPRNVYRVKYKRYSTEHTILVMARSAQETLDACKPYWQRTHYTKDCEVVSVDKELTLNAVANC